MRVLFVCTGNVCRSPLAEGYLKHLLGQRRMQGIEVRSAGIAALSGSAPFDCAQTVALHHGFDIEGIIARQLTPAMIAEFDRVLCMETRHAQSVMSMDPRSAGKVGLLGSYQPEGRPLTQIPDPVQFNEPETMRTFEAIRSSVDGYLESLIRQNEGVK